MRPLLLLLFFLLSLPRPGQAQLSVVWNRSYGSALDEYQGYAVAMPTGGYLLLGEVSYPGFPQASPDHYLYFVRTNATGDTLWTKRMVPPRTVQPKPTSLLVDPAGNVVVTGLDVGGSKYAFLLKLTPAGDTIWTKSIKAIGTTGLSAGFGRVVIAPDGNYLSGEAKTYSFPTSSGYQTESNIVKYEALTGRKLWSYNLTAFLANNGLNPNLSSGTFSVRTGNNYLFGLQGQLLVTSQRAEGTFVVADANGTCSNLKLRPTTGVNSYPVAFASTDGNVVVGRRQMATKLTPLGDTLWHTPVPRRLGRDWDAASLCEDAQGNYVLAANSSFVVGTGVNADNVHLIRFQRQSGQLANDTMLYRPGQTYAGTVLRAPGGQLVLAGWANYGPYGGSDLYLAAWSAYRPLATRAGSGGPLAAGLRVWPNPAGAAGATVQLPMAARYGGTLAVFDGQGRACARRPVPAGAAAVALPLAGLLPGLYLLRYEGRDGQRANARLLRE